MPRNWELAFEYSDSGAESIFDLFSGSVDIVFMGLTPFVYGCSLGLPLRLLAIGPRIKESHSIVLRKVPPRGDLVIGTTYGSTGHHLGHAWINLPRIRLLRMINRLNVRFMNFPSKYLPKAFERGTIDGIAAWEPLTTLCIQYGGKKVFSAADCQIPLHNAIVLNADCRRIDDPLVQVFAAAYDAAIAQVKSSASDELIQCLPADYWAGIPPERHKEILESSIDWPDVFLANDQSVLISVRHAISASEDFLKIAQLLARQRAKQSNVLTGPPGVAQTDTRPKVRLTIGYSNNTICIPFHFGLRRDIFKDRGFAPTRETLRVEDRIAALDNPFREFLEKILVTARTDPEESLSRCRRELTSILEAAYQRYFRKPAPSSNEAIIEKLAHHGILSPYVQAAAHRVRTSGNKAEHRIYSSERFALETIPFLVTICEWKVDVGDKLLSEFFSCWKCDKRLEVNWDSCPYCGKYVGTVCPNPKCPTRNNSEWRVQPEWKTCPTCKTQIP